MKEYSVLQRELRDSQESFAHQSGVNEVVIREKEAVERRLYSVVAEKASFCVFLANCDRRNSRRTLLRPRHHF